MVNIFCMTTEAQFLHLKTCTDVIYSPVESLQAIKEAETGK